MLLRSLCVIWLVAAVTFPALPANAQALGQITGTVRDTTNGPLAGVTVTLTGITDRAVQTGVDGLFRFDGLPKGDYVLEATLTGFASLRQSLRLDAAAIEQLSLTLSVQISASTVVTAEKVRARELQEIPAAITVLPGADLRRVEANSIEHIAGLAPSLTFSQNTGFSQLTIRGIGTTAVFAGSDPSSTVYLDGVYLARPAMALASLFALERVEVLRGPQGTLYGRNAVGGAVNLVTRTPTNEMSMATRGVVGERKTLRAEAWVSGPILRGRILGSAALVRGTSRGFVKDLTHPDNPLGGEDVTAGRGHVRIIFNPRSDLLLSADLTHQDPAPLTYAKVLSVKPGFLVDNPRDPREVRFSTPPWSRQLQWGGTARFTTYVTPSTALTSLTAFRKLDYELLNDGDITELNLTGAHVHEIHHQISEELIVSHERSRVAWLAGLFLFHEHDRQPTMIDLGGARLRSRLDPKVEAGAGAGFGQATIGLTGHLSVIAGLRFASERKSIDNAGEITSLDSPSVVIPGSAYDYADAISHTVWTPKLGLEIRARDGLLVHVAATKGSKTGGFNLTSTEPGRGYAPESAWSYEGGLKAVIGSGHASVSVSAYQTAYTNLQVQTAIQPGVIDISNAAEATIRGVETEAVTSLGLGVNAGGHVAWMQSQYDRYIAVGLGGVTGDVAGHRLSNAPDWSGRLWLEWSKRIVGAGTLSLRADVRCQSTVFFTPFNDPIQQQQPYSLLDVGAEFGPDRRRWTIGAYARNLTGEDYITGTFSSPPPAIGGRPGPPRQAGIQLTIWR
jgi:iron complex outermembrane receptor protein